MIRTLQPGQRCEVWIASATGERGLAFATEDVLLEAPNWTLDGAAPDLNNDHVLDPDGEHIFLSANDDHIYRAALAGGQAARITKDDGSFNFLHGVSPDGQELAYVSIEAGDFTRPGRLMTIPAGGGASTPVSVGGHCDGPEYSPDGDWLYFNTGAFTSQPGHAQLARVRVSGGSTPNGGGANNKGPEQLLTSDTVDWFPQLSPDGRLASYIRFPNGTQGHPADLPVDVVLVSTDEWAAPLHTWPLFGGQGTLNVNSWAPDSARLADVAYPLTRPTMKKD